jgi:hypothetical protein
MKLAEKVLNKQKNEMADEKEVIKRLNTRVKGQIENYGSRSARILVQEGMKILNNMLNKDHPSPNPRTQADMVMMKEAVHMGGEMVKKIKSVKETKRAMQESIDEMDYKKEAMKIVSELKKMASKLDMKGDDSTQGLYEAIYKSHQMIEKALKDMK